MMPGFTTTNGIVREASSRPVSTYEVARRGNRVVRAGGDTLRLYRDEAGNLKLIHVWHAWARAGYRFEDAVDLMLRQMAPGMEGGMA